MLDSPPTERPTARLPAAAPRGPLAWCGVVFFVVLVGFHWRTLDEPPVWDAAMSVFPAAITLAAHDLDYGHLLAQPGYAVGGPNVHGLSSVTLVTALVYWLLGPQPTLVMPVLHLLHLAAAALALAFVCRLAQAAVGKLAGVAVAAVALLHPLLQSQAGTIYLEVPLMLGAAGALDAWVRRRTSHAILWAAAAGLVKPSGAIVGAALALATLVRGEGPLRRRLWMAMAYAPGAILPIVLQLVLDPARVNFTHVLSTSIDYALAAPDLLLLPAACLVLLAASRPWQWSTAEAVGEHTLGEAQRVQLACGCLIVAFYAFFAFIAAVGSAVAILPRYNLLILPFAIVGLAGVLRPRLSPPVAATVLLAAAVFFVANRRGACYPEADNNFAMLERSLEYRDMVAVQLRGLRELERLPRTLPVFYSKSEHYKLHYPGMGYARAPLPNGHSLAHEQPWSQGRLEDFPPSFAVLVEHEWMGGEVGLGVLLQAAFDPSRRVQREEICVGKRCTLLARVDPAPAAAAARR